ncbi:MAG: hypothetical protein GEU73_10895 [Chloroflexi bacterium]|nr:hypothetical protein [Chloroflexota bacterium]
MQGETAREGPREAGQTMLTAGDIRGVTAMAPTVITTKIAYGIEHLREDLDAAGHRINLQPGQANAYAAYKIVGKKGLVLERALGMRG